MTKYNKGVALETGATSHAVNDLVLFTENTRELAEFRDNLYSDWVNAGSFGTYKLYERFVALFDAARKQYDKDLSRISLLDYSDCIEYCQFYVCNFDKWKLEHT